MPNRYIKESCTLSGTLTVLSDAAERFFWRLTTVADDYGRFDANPAVLQGRVVPTLRWPIRKVEKCLAELTAVAPGDEVPLVQLYEVKGRRFLSITNWKEHQRDRTKEKDPPKSKFPDPIQFIPSLPQLAAVRGESQQNAALNESESDNENDTVHRSRPHSAADDSTERFECEFWNPYPKRDGKKIGKAEALAKYRQLSDADRNLLKIALSNFLLAPSTQRSIGIKDAHRWLRNGHGVEPWREWLEPAEKDKPRPPAPPPKNDPIARGLWKQQYGDPREFGYD